MKLTAYIAAKKGIEEYLMKEILKVHYKLEHKIWRWKVMPNKSTLINWTYRTCWNSGVSSPAFSEWLPKQWWRPWQIPWSKCWLYHTNLLKKDSSKVLLQKMVRHPTCIILSNQLGHTGDGWRDALCTHVLLGLLQGRLPIRLCPGRRARLQNLHCQPLVPFDWFK